MAMRFFLSLVVLLCFVGKAASFPAWGDTPAAQAATIDKATLSTGIKPWKSFRWSTEPLSQNQPNPAVRYTIIYFNIDHSGPASLKLFTVAGREIGYFIDDFCDAGTYRVKFNVDFLAKGQYFYRLKTPENVYVRKMIVVK
jgi:hypothetical protein